MKNSHKFIRRHRRTPRFVAVAALLALLAGLTIGGTVAYLLDRTEPVVNQFTPSEVTVDVDENFDGTVKKNVTAVNTGNIPAYIRITLVTYRVNEAGQRIGGTAQIPSFTPGEGWIKKNDGCYYYTKPVAPGESPDAPLIGEDGINLQKYDDADGGKQVVEVIAEAIQAEPADAVKSAWGVTVQADGTIG